MVKKISLSVTDWVFDKYLLTTHKLNRSKYIEEMFMKGVDSEVQEWNGVHSKLVEATRQVREQSQQIANLQRELASVKSRVMTQEKRRAEKSAKKREKALLKSIGMKGDADIEESLYEN